MRLGAAHHALAPPILDDRLRGFGPRPVVAMERTRRKVAIKLRAIGGELHLKSVKDFFGQASFFFQAEDGIRHPLVTGVQKCALPIYIGPADVGAGALTRPDEGVRAYVTCT